MRIVLRLPVIAILAATCGCHVHPLPDDVTGLQTYQIIDKIRCEAMATISAIYKNGSLRADGVYAHLKPALYPHGVLFSGKDGYNKEKTEITRAREELKELQKSATILDERAARLRTRATLNQLRRDKTQSALYTQAARLSPDQAKAIFDLAQAEYDDEERLIKAAVTQYKIDKLAFDTKFLARQRIIDARAQKFSQDYDDYNDFMSRRFAYLLNFKITEKNTNKSESSWRVPLPLGTLTVDKINPADERERSTDRKVSVVASFEEILNSNGCSASDMSGLAIRRYPIEGSVGVGEVIEQYMKVAEGQKKSKFQKGKETDPPYSDKITFKTTISGGLTPKVTITHANQTVAGSLEMSASRTDEHILLVSLTLEDDKPAGDSDREKITKVQIVREQDF